MMSLFKIIESIFVFIQENVTYLYLLRNIFKIKKYRYIFVKYIFLYVYIEKNIYSEILILKLILSLKNKLLTLKYINFHIFLPTYFNIAVGNLTGIKLIITYRYRF